MKLRVLVSVVALTAGLTLAFALSRYPVISWPAVLLLGMLAWGTENFSVELPVLGSVSLSFGIAYAAVLYAGPVGAAVVALLASWNIQDLNEHKPLIAMMYNATQLPLSALLAGIVFVACGGAPLGGPSAPMALVPIACVTAALTFYAMNVLLVGSYVSSSRGLSFGNVIRQQRFLSDGTSMFILALLGLVLAEALDVAGPVAVVLVAAPFIVARQTIRAYEELKSAYVETVRCLVSTIEAKDRYTRGHSERVAKYAALISESLHLNRQTAERIEFAALLHDVGKIAVDNSILQKEGPLTQTQYEEIKQHPLTGARILGEIELLSDIVPIIRAHHEHVDGTGYPDGLRYSEIPMESRILAVADCYDAMTSDRPYRSALPVSVAAAELDRSAGAQLDRPAVAALIKQLGR